MNLILTVTANSTHDGGGDHIYARLANNARNIDFTVNESNPILIKNGQTKTMNIFEGYVGEESRNRHQEFQIDLYDDDNWPNGDDLLAVLFTKSRTIGNTTDVTWNGSSRTHLISIDHSNLSSNFISTGSGTDYAIQAKWVLSNNVRKITNKKSNKCLDVVNEWKGKANVQQWTCKTKQSHNTVENQRWYIRNLGIHTFSSPSGASSVIFYALGIFANHSGDCLDVEAGLGQKKDRRNVQQFSPHLGINQKWYILPSEERGFFFILDQKLRALDVADGSNNDNANVQVYPFHGGDNQKWKIDPPPTRRDFMGDLSSNLSGEEFVKTYLSQIR